MNLFKSKLRTLGVALAVLGVLGVGLGVVVAQEETRQLVPGTPLTGTLGAETFAQSYWFEGTEDQQATLLAAAAEGLDLGMIVADADGNPLAQNADVEAAGTASISGLALPATGRYYVTVMRLSAPDSEAAGDFSLTLVLEGETATTPEAEATPAGSVGPSLVTLDAGIDVTLTWASTADLDLEVRDPFGNSVYWDNPTAENAVFDRNANANCVDTTAENPTERVLWSPGASPVGSYEIIVYYVQGCDNNDPVTASINVTVDGTALDSISATLTPGQEYLASFRVPASGPASAGPSGLNPGEALSNASSVLTGQTPIESDASVTGMITAADPFATYSFTGAAGDIITVRMDASDGNLDPKLFLLDANGNTVAVNDDVETGNTNAEIRNQTLVSDGLYTIVATHYGQEVGGTEGNYTLTLSGANLEVPPALAGLDLPAGSVEVSLLWNTNADLQLLVRDPSGASVFDDTPTSNSGGSLNRNGNVNCANTSTSPVSYIYWPPDRLPPGTYEVEVWYQSNCDDASPVTFSLTVRVNDQVILSRTAQPIPGQIYLTSFTVDVNGFASAGQGGILGDSSVLDIGSALSGAVPIAYGDTVSGTITQNNKFVLYTFDGQAGDQIRIGMQATAGTLDTSLYLLSPDGAQVAANDDAVVNETTDSLIDTYTLPSDGTYIIVASHYGLLYGGTSGTYNLSLTRLN
jgi:uncharacterized protein YfaP (DUF2135 family)